MEKHGEVGSVIDARVREVHDVDLVAIRHRVQVEVRPAELDVAPDPTGVALVWRQEVAGLEDRRTGADRSSQLLLKRGWSNWLVGASLLRDVLNLGDELWRFSYVWISRRLWPFIRR